MIDSHDWAGRQVFLTGHTGFKGAWLGRWLQRMGAQVYGYALPPESSPNLFTMLPELASSTLADIRDPARLKQALKDCQPEIVFHLAAQALVRRSYREPAETWSTNVLGTLNVLEAVRAVPSVRAVVIVTTDKCYENRGWPWGYRETDRLGGHDPYSASKACAEILTDSQRRSFFAAADAPLIATARAGNVIGGGDWSEDRLVPDAIRAIAAGCPLHVRHPAATRPWQHVLDCLSGYLVLGKRLLDGDAAAARAYNFGPHPDANLPVGEVLARFKRAWPELAWTQDAVPQPHEAAFLYLDSSLAHSQLAWSPHWNVDQAIARTAAWYRDHAANPKDALRLTDAHIEEHSAI
jgi:CDP-glucose 4,6-dehydratase